VSGCPDPSVLEAFGQGTLDAASRDALDVHLDRCSACAAVVVQLAQMYGSPSMGMGSRNRTIPDAASSTPPAAQDVGMRVGRYVLGRRLGAGGMGVVHEAIDPELHRRVAIKLLHPGISGDVDGTQSRMLREARAMAQLAHPNVVAVHDVGRVGEQVFVAMELVEGETLARWLQSKRHERREILATFVQAGRGLEAAHAVGLVHRDFKPDNVLIGADGRARVTDFGLARPAMSWAEAADASTVVSAAASLGITLQGNVLTTAHGAIVGTPAYMAPEQWRGAPADARSDQFAFCVALFEACFGMRPFAGDDLFALAEQVMRGNLRAPPRSAPAWLRAAIVQGLQLDPAARHPSMSALLGALERDRTRLRRALGIAGAMGLGVAGTVAVLAWTTEQTAPAPPLPNLPIAKEEPEAPRDTPVEAPAPTPPVDPQLAACRARATDAEGRWNAARRSKLDTFLRKMDDGDAIAARTLPVLDGWAARWTNLAGAACAAAGVAETQRRCLAETLPYFDALVQQALEQQTFAVDDAIAWSTYRLPDLGACEHAAWLAVHPSPPPAEKAAEVMLVRGELAIANAHTQLSVLSSSAEMMARVVERATAIGYAPLVAEAQLALGVAHLERYEHDEAAVALEAAALASQGGVYDRVALQSSTLLVEVYGGALLRRLDAERWQGVAASIDSRFDDARTRGALSLATGLAMHGRAERGAAIASFDAARTDLVLALGNDHPEVARLLLATARTRAALGEHEDAVQMTERAIEILGKSVGAVDLRYGDALAQRARNLLAKGSLGPALDAANLAVKVPIFSQSVRHDLDHGWFLGVLGEAQAANGKPTDALATWEKAKIYLYVGWPRVWPLVWQGALLVESGRVHEGLVRLDEARAELDKHLGADDPRRVDPLRAIGRAEHRAGKLAAARKTLERALAIAEASAGFSPFTSLAMWDLAAVERADGKTKRALELYDDAHVPLAGAFAQRAPDMVESLLARADLAWELDQKDYAGRLYDSVADDLTKQRGPKDAGTMRARERRIAQQ
jgi:tetratricopeptide (TPR) repeat protein/tRNA A-37 threonylcarbamoyl transferase component Bud32